MLINFNSVMDQGLFIIHDFWLTTLECEPICGNNLYILIVINEASLKFFIFVQPQKQKLHSSLNSIASLWSLVLCDEWPSDTLAEYSSLKMKARPSLIAAGGVRFMVLVGSPRGSL